MLSSTSGVGEGVPEMGASGLKNGLGADGGEGSGAVLVEGSCAVPVAGVDLSDDLRLPTND